MNGVAEKIEFRKDDCFRVIETLHGAGEGSAIILDPPKMARHKKSLPDALRRLPQIKPPCDGNVSLPAVCS
ncbi:MAG: hypothetical protein U0903_13210 [Planctomycetales bacterium]